MTVRVGVLLDEVERKLGAISVPETVFVVRHDGRYFVRSDKGLRLPGGGIGVVFQETEVYVREKLNPILGRPR